LQVRVEQGPGVTNVSGTYDKAYAVRVNYDVDCALLWRARLGGLGPEGVIKISC
jgi:hypothetical protein